MSSFITTIESAKDKVSDVSVGSTQTTTTWYPTHGDTSWWSADVDWWWDNGNPERDTAKFSGTNGKDHTENFSLGGSRGRYPTKQLRCVEFEFCQNSNKGHALYLRRYGLKWQKESPTLPGGASLTFWSSGSMGRRSDYDWHRVYLPFGELGFDNFLNEYHHFIGIALQVSSAGGTGKRETELRIRNLKYQWRSKGGHHLIVPPQRPYAERFQQNRIA